MDGRIREAFDQIRADDALKARTRARVAERMRARTRAQMAPRIALALMCVLLTIAGGFAYLTPVSAISLDVNPSIELALNRFDRVVSARGLNEDGDALVSGLNLFGYDYRDAVDAIIGSDAMAQYLAGGEQVAVTVACDNAQRSAALLEGVSGCAAVARGAACCYAISGELAEQARAAGVSPGRYRAMLELMELDPDVTLEQAGALSMSELRARIAALGDAGRACDLSGCDGSGGNCAVHGGEPADAEALYGDAADDGLAAGDAADDVPTGATPTAVEPDSAPTQGANGQGNGDGQGYGPSNGNGQGNGSGHADSHGNGHHSDH